MAKANKRFYWIQLAEDFFKSKEMKLLRKIAGGDTYTIIYLKMMLMSLEDGGHIYYENIANTIAEEISLVIDESVDDIQLVLSFLESKGLLTRPSEDEYFLEQVPELTGSETASARRVRRHRQQKALQSNTDETKCIGEIDIEIEKDIELDREIDKKPLLPAIDLSVKELFDYYQQVFKKPIPPIHIEEINKYLDEDNYPPEVIKNAIDKAVMKEVLNFKYVEGILRDWKAKGIKTLEQIEADDKAFEERKAKRNGTVTRGKSLKDEVGF